MKNLNVALLGVVLLLLNSNVARAADKITFPPTQTVQGKPLVLNGVGIRKATILKVKVYHAGLYLESKSGDADAILNSKQLKKIDMRFVHDVSAHKLRDAWSEGLEKNCQKDCKALEPGLKQLNSYMTDIQDGQSMALVFGPDKVEVTVNGKVAGTIPGAAFSRTLLAIWLGQDPPNDSLKSGMLGKE